MINFSRRCRRGRTLRWGPDDLVQRLEPRRHLTSVVGTAETDVILFDSIGGVATITVNGTPTPVLDNVVQIDGAAGDDLIRVRNPGARSFTLLGSAGEDEIDVQAGSGPMILDGGADPDTHIVQEGTVTVRGGSGLDDVTVNPDATGAASVVVDRSEAWGNLTVREGGSVSIASNGVAGLSVDAVGTLRGTIDLTNRYFLVRFPTDATLVEAVQRGYASGTWSGTPTAAGGVITSSFARNSVSGDGVGYAVIGRAPGELDIRSFRGRDVFGDELALSYARYGDADLDGQVGFSDLLRLAQNYGSMAANWTRGDFNFDGVVGFSDLLELARNYGTTAFIDQDSTRAEPDSRAKKTWLVPFDAL
jgi:hypothetical protein